jgi:hypothetical protein
MAVALSLYGVGTIVFVVAAHQDATSAWVLPAIATVAVLAVSPTVSACGWWPKA